MTLKKQWSTVKDNWLLIALLIVVVAAMNLDGISRVSYSLSGGNGYATEEYARGAAMPDMAIMPPYYGDDGFAPDVDERIVTKNAYLSTEVERGTFMASEQRLKSILMSGDTIVLSENVHVYDTERRAYYQGSYTVKVAVQDYDAIIAQLKTLGEVQSFSENQDDITGQYTSLQSRLSTERTRLERYQAMYAEAERVEDKINLNDRIFNQEMQIKYLEEQIANQDQRVEYSTVSITMTEERSEYVNIALTKLSDLVRAFVGSVNNILTLLVTIVPWVLLAGIGRVVWKRVRR